jgi:hypothetical protein
MFWRSIEKSYAKFDGVLWAEPIFIFEKENIMEPTVLLIDEKMSIPSFADLEFKYTGTKSWEMEDDVFLEFLEPRVANDEAMREILNDPSKTVGALTAWYVLWMEKTGMDCRVIRTDFSVGFQNG